METLAEDTTSDLTWKFDPTKTPARPVSSDRWGSLEPVALFIDQTDAPGEPGDLTYAFDLDVVGNYVYMATGVGMAIYDISDPAHPKREAYLNARTTAPYWSISDKNHFMKTISVPAGNPNIAALGSEEQGFFIVNTTTKRNPSWHYQDDRSMVKGDVYAARVGATDFAFAVNDDNGLVAYDMTRASSLTKCQASKSSCNGAYLGPIAGKGRSYALHGTGTYLAYRADSSLTIYDITNASRLPATTLPARLNATLPAGVSYGKIAMWQSGFGYYVAAAVYVSASEGYFDVYDVSCITSSCSSSIQPLKRLGPFPHLMTHVDVSFVGTIPYVYASDQNVVAPCVPQREYLFDVSNPSNPVDVTPHTSPSGYWGWYYEKCSTGANYFQAMQGQFDSRGNFVRAAYTVADIHRLTTISCTPTASFMWSPTTPFIGSTVQFTDTSSCNPDSWSWSFPADTTFWNGTGTQDQNPVVSFGAAGAHSVNLVAGNASGWSPTNYLNVMVQDPSPHVTSLSASTPETQGCGQVTFTAEGVTGDNPQYEWSIQLVRPESPLIFADDFESSDVSQWSTNLGFTATAGSPAAPAVKAVPAAKVVPAKAATCTPSGNTCVWNVDPAEMLGYYTATVRVYNSFDLTGETVTSSEVHLGAPAPITVGTPTADTPSSTVAFDVDSANVTDWLWDFGDGTTSDWIKTSSTTHEYQSGGPYTVKVSVKNCTEGPIDSPSLAIDVPNPAPLEITTFAVAGKTCSGSDCFYKIDETASFNVVVVGEPDSYEYDWDSTACTFGGAMETSTTPVTSHAWSIPSAMGTPFRPMLKIVRGAESVTKCLSKKIYVN